MKKKNATNIQPVNRATNPKKKNIDSNHNLTEDSVDDSSKISDKSQTKKSSKINTNTNYTALNINAPPYKSYRKHIDRKKNTNGLFKNIRNNEKINSSYSNKSNVNKTPKTPRKIAWMQNITSTSNILKNLMDKYNNNLIELKRYAFNKISSLSKDIIFQNLLTIKKQINDLFDIINKQTENNIKKNNQNPFDYNKIMLNFVEYLTKKLEKNSENLEKVEKSNENRKIKTYKSNPSLLELKVVEIMTKENGVSFEYPINKKRSLSFKVEERLRGSSKSSEEISRHIKEKMDTAEKNREIIWKNQADSSNKINEKISEIRYKQKEEKKRKLNKIYTK